MEHGLEELAWALWGREYGPQQKASRCVPTAVFKNVAPQALVELRGTRNTGKRRGVRNIFGLAMCDKAKQ